MKKLMISILLSIGLIMPVWAGAEGLKIGFVDGARLLKSSPQAKAAGERISKEFEPRQQELLKAREQLQKREEKFVKDSAFMSAAEKQKKEREIIAAKREMQLNETDFREELTIRNNDEMAKVLEEVRAAIQSFGKKEKYDLILFEGVAYASAQVDVTDQVLNQLTK